MQSVKIINKFTIERESYIDFYVNNPIDYNSFKWNKILRDKITELNKDNKLINFTLYNCLLWTMKFKHLKSVLFSPQNNEPIEICYTQLALLIPYLIWKDIKQTMIANTANQVDMISKWISDKLSVVNNELETLTTENLTSEYINMENVLLDDIIHQWNWYHSESDSLLNYCIALLKLDNWAMSLTLLDKNKRQKRFNYLDIRKAKEFQKIKSYGNEISSLTNSFNFSNSESKNYRAEYFIYIMLSSTSELYFVINPFSWDINVVDSYNLYKFMDLSSCIILPLWLLWENMLLMTQDLDLNKYQLLSSVYAKTDVSGIVWKLEHYLADPQIKSFECEKKESHYILKPTYLKYQWGQIPNKVIKDTEEYGHKQEVNHREEKQIYYTPTYKLPKVANKNWKIIDSN